MADFELVPVGIFEKDGVIAGAVLEAKLGPFDVFRASLANDLGNLIHGFAARRPERDPVPVRPMIRLLFESKEINADGVLCLEQAPFLAALVDAKSDRRQNLRVKMLGGFAVLYPQINVIEQTRGHPL